MDSTPNPKQTDAHCVLNARLEEARTHEEIPRAAEKITQSQEQPSNHDAARRDDPQATPKTRRHKTALRGLTALLLAAGIGVAAIAWQSSYGKAAKLIISQWAPQLVQNPSLPLKEPGLSAQSSPDTVQVTAAEQFYPQAAPLALNARQDSAPIAVPVSPELTRLLQTMARDLAMVQEGVEQLKANQGQTLRDNAKLAEQLKGSQEQIVRVIAKVSEQNTRPKTSAPAPRPIGTQTPLSLTSPTDPRVVGARPAASVNRSAAGKT